MPKAAHQPLSSIFRVGQNHKYLYICTNLRCTYGNFSREITGHMVIYGVYIRFWPTLSIFLQQAPFYVFSMHIAVHTIMGSYCRGMWWRRGPFCASAAQCCLCTHVHMYTRTHVHTLFTYKPHSAAAHQQHSVAYMHTYTPCLRKHHSTHMFCASAHCVY
jgi:hypothetical protein